MTIKFNKHFINNLLTFRAINLLNIYVKMKLINKTLLLCKSLLTCLIMLIKVLFYSINFKILN